VSLIEMILVLALVGIVTGLLFINLAGRRSENDLRNTAAHVAALLREAQSRSVVQASSTSWGVHFENATTTAPFYALFHTAYSTSTRFNYFRLPQSVDYITSTLPDGAAKEIIFSEFTGTASAATSVRIYLINQPARSSTITVDASGAVY
jgi:type II secretory pathway pseudopilin PulG